MKTLDEVIADLDKWMERAVDISLDTVSDAWEYLRIYRDQLEIDKKPLTWDELTEMKGKPVWVEIESDKRWEIVEKTGENGWAEGEWLETNDSMYRREEQWTSWNAYRKERE